MPTPTAPKHSFRALRDDLQAALLGSYPEHVARLRWSRTQVAALAGAGLADPVVALRQAPHLTRDLATGKLRRFVPLQRPRP